MQLNRNQDFMFEDTTQLTTNAKSLKGALNEVNASLASMTQQNYLIVQSSTYANLCPKDGGGNVTDWLPAINQAMTDSVTVRKPILLPYGNIPISNSITVNHNDIRFVGYGKSLSIIKPQGAFPAIIFNGNSTTGVFYNELKDLRIDGGGIATIGVQFSWARECWINDCYITNCVKGVYGVQSWSNAIRSSEIMTNLNTNVELNAQCNDFTLIDVQMDNAGVYGLHLSSESYGQSFIGCCIQNCGQDGFLADAGRALSIVGGYLENNNTSKTSGCGDIHISGSSSTVVGFSISGTAIWTKFSTAAIVLDKVYEGSITGVSAGLDATGTCSYIIQTSSNTNSVLDSGNYHVFAGSGRNDGTAKLMRIDNKTLFNVAFPYGATASRPSSPMGGQSFFDTSNAKPIWYNPNNNYWIDSNNVIPSNHGTLIPVTPSASMITITLPVQEYDANYGVFVTLSWNTTYWVIQRYSNQFEIHFGTAAPSNATVDWFIRR